MMNFELIQPLSQKMEYQEKVGDDEKRVDYELNRKSAQGFDDFLFHEARLLKRLRDAPGVELVDRRWIDTFQFQDFTDLTWLQHLPVASDRAKKQITLQTGRFFLTLHFILGKKPWPMPRTNTPKM